MQSLARDLVRNFATAIMGMVISASVFAAGMVPETTVVILQESEGEASINVKNTDPGPALLYSSIEDIPEDTDAIVALTPPVARVEAGETQLVRLILQADEPLKTQRLKRVFFEGIPERDPSNGANSKLTMTVRQNLPVLINPKGLARNDEPWKLLKWAIAGDQLTVSNDSAYVVRLAQTVQLKPNGETAQLPRPYLLPGDKLSLPLTPASTGTPTAVTLSPATVYGYSVDTYDAPLGAPGK